MIYTKRLQPIELSSTWYYLKYLDSITKAAGNHIDVPFSLEGITGTINNAYFVGSFSKPQPLPTIPMYQHTLRIKKGSSSKTVDIEYGDNIAIDFKTVITGDGDYTIRVHQREHQGYNSSTGERRNFSVYDNSVWVDMWHFVSGHDDVYGNSDEVRNMYYTRPINSKEYDQTWGFKLLNTTSISDIMIVVATDGDSITVDSQGHIDVRVENEGIYADAICLFDSGEHDFTGNGLAMLHPNSCVVKETAGSDYSLSMEYPITDDRWKLIRPGRLIQCPVPEAYTPEFELADSSFWRVKTKTSIYAKPCVSYSSYKTTESSNANLGTTTSGNRTGVVNDISTNSTVTVDVTTRDGRQTVSTWSSSATYGNGDYVLYGGQVYRCTTVPYMPRNDRRPPGQSPNYYCVGSYEHVYNRTDHTTEDEKKTELRTVPTQTYGELAVDDVVMVIAVVNTFWVQIRVTQNNQTIIGYVKAECLEAYDGVPEGETNVVAPRHIKRQAFRITSVSVDSGNGVLTVEAMHKSYDLQKTMLSACKLENISPSVAIAVVQTSEMAIKDSRLIATNISADRNNANDCLNNITGDWGWDNALAAFIDSDNGIVFQTKAKLVRDNDDFFLLKNEISETPSYTFSARTNLHGVTWTIDDSEVVTRVIPTYQNEDGGVELITGMYVDADNANDFPEYRCEVLDTGLKIGEYTIVNGQSILFKEGEKYTSEDSTAEDKTVKLTKAKMESIVREKAQNRFDVDKANLIKHTVSIDFTMLGDTDEYASIKALGEARLYDTVRVKIDEIGLDINTQVDGYEWDCTNPKRPFMRALTLSDAYRGNDWPVSGIRIKAGSIKYDKLSRTAREKINELSNVAIAEAMKTAVESARIYTNQKVGN